VVFWGDPPLADRVAFDIKPTSCPNPLNVNNQGVLPVAILGTADFDVSTVDPATVTLQGVAPLMWAFEDVATPVAPGGDECECTTAGPDGYMDLTLKYDTPDIAMALYPVVDGEIRVLTMRGTADGCRPIMGQDCVRIIWKKKPPKRPISDAGIHGQPHPLDCFGSYPNPFNAETSIHYSLPERAQVSLVVYNVLGERVKTLVSGEVDAGYHIVHWDGKNANGSMVASGIYFYRFETKGLAKTMKMVLMR